MVFELKFSDIESYNAVVKALVTNNIANEGAVVWKKHPDYAIDYLLIRIKED